MAQTHGRTADDDTQTHGRTADIDTVEHVGTSAANVARALRGINFPATKDELIEWARQHGAEKEVMEILQKLPGKGEYQTMADVFHNMHRVMA
jgi:hypothetical protein